jgi:dTDP-4-dehydrorhamnose 3,5-epimerase
MLEDAGMKATTTGLPGVVVFEPKVFGDVRGFVFEAWRMEFLARFSIPPFVQENHSRSAMGTLRGFHYQLRRPQGKLVRVLRGRVLDVVADIRTGSPTFGKVEQMELDDVAHRLVYVPPGYAHAFCALEEGTEVEYKLTDYYEASDRCGVAWDDPTLGVAWPVISPLLSERDRAWLRLDAPRDDLPAFEA